MCVPQKAAVYPFYKSLCLLVDVRQRSRNDAPVRVPSIECDRVCVSLMRVHTRLIAIELLGPSGDCEGLSASGLTVSKDGAVVSSQNAVNLVNCIK